MQATNEQIIPHILLDRLQKTLSTFQFVKRHDCRWNKKFTEITHFYREGFSIEDVTNALCQKVWEHVGSGTIYYGGIICAEFNVPNSRLYTRLWIDNPAVPDVQ